ncbi:MAG TPA: hypothetical protein VHM67_10600, partial [Gemmatimonadaceae bacterium]|nr:hypothetical protein [Gemmatimonadaceae bacterium]
MKAPATLPGRRVLWTALAALVAYMLPATSLAAQQSGTGTLQITVVEAMGMVGGLLVRSGSQSARTDAEGRARLTLLAGPHAVSVTGIGFKPVQVWVEILPDTVVTATVRVEMLEMVMEEVRVSATRTERLAGETPERVEVL